MAGPNFLFRKLAKLSQVTNHNKIHSKLHTPLVGARTHNLNLTLTREGGAISRAHWPYGT